VSYNQAAQIVMSFCCLRKGVVIAALAASAALCCAGQPDSDRQKTNSLFLWNDTFMAPANGQVDVSQLEVDDKTDETKVRYTLAARGTWDPADFTPNAANCGALLGLAAVLGIGSVLRNRLYPS
jgi:hypothetical protein